MNGRQIMFHLKSSQRAPSKTYIWQTGALYHAGEAVTSVYSLTSEHYRHCIIVARITVKPYRYGARDRRVQISWTQRGTDA